ncbi:hypothetical protein [Nonomuraea sp. NPDC005650]|uniref:hypothetical protein n=1 Tax=Nonomuraea sp. NPDC005650 TaxID=3157045 RepID=UPI0033B72A1D
MRGQEPGSEHDRREADGSAAPATPPPSFGQTSGRDVPPAFAPADEAVSGSADDAAHSPSDDVEPASPDDVPPAPPGAAADAGQPVVPVLRAAPEPDEPPGAQPWEVADAGARPVVPVFRAAAPEPDQPPGAQPWEVAGDDAAPYDWYDDESEPTRPGGLRPPAADATRSGHPQGEPDDPDRTIADRLRTRGEQARAEQVRAVRPWDWDEPEHELGSWPAEPVVPGAPSWEPPPAFTAAAADMPVWPAPQGGPHAMPPWPAATGELVAEPDNDEPGSPFDPNATSPDGLTRPAHYFDPEAARREAAQQAEARAQHPSPADEETPPDGFLPAPTAAPEEDVTRPALPSFGPMPAEHGAPPLSLSDPANPSAHPPEPGDVPVWPPTPASEAKLPDLPFPRDTWGQKPTAPLSRPSGGSPAFPPGAFKQAPFQTPPPPPAPPGKSRRALLVTLGALALAGVATGGFFAYQAVSSPTPTTAAALPSTSVEPSTQAPAAAPSDAPDGTSILNSEQTDPQKLSLSEAFPKKKVSAAGTTFTRVKAAMESSCDKAATGEFADALKEQKCGRVLRATYVDSKHRYAVTTGIAVLPDKDAAIIADQSKDLSHNVWFRPLPGAEGSGGERVNIAGGYAAGMLWGRYIVFSYATYADGHTPESKDKALPKVSGAFRDQTSLVLERRVTKG